MHGTKRYTIVRNGVIGGKPRETTHKCGSPGTKRYPYRVTLTVRGNLTGPDYFIVDNREVDDYVQAVFVRNRFGMSCERMCDEMLNCLHDMLSNYPQWTAERIHVELTGTNGAAWLSAEWTAA